MPILFHIESFGQYYLAYLQKCQLPLVAGVGVDFRAWQRGWGTATLKLSHTSADAGFSSFDRSASILAVSLVN